MKNTLLQLGLCLVAAGTMHANVITVSNNAIAAGMYNNLQTACNAANVGDTVYVMGSPTDYGTVNVKTRIVLIGAGYALTGTQNNWSSIVDYIHLDSVAFGNQVSGTKIMGFSVSSNIDNSGSAGSINNIDIERCYISSWIYVEGINWVVRNNDVYGVQVQNWNNCYIQNNFLGNVQYSNKTTVVIDHNTFNTSSGNCFYSISNALIANNIFYYCSPLANTTSCTFSNNITTNSSAQVLPPAGNTGSGNINNTPPGWTDPTIPASTVSQNSIWNYSWKLGSSAPAHNSATDGTDLGAFGGSYPMSNMTGATRIPQMQILNVSGVVPAGGNLNVNFKARKQN
ncbi:MAG TPA: hypothetical protein VNZ86_07055 [Bacteroidia bacterium]|jgi:hypothetical protein|nr:hypothetical protein [Bacteroidia bacterium]